MSSISNGSIRKALPCCGPCRRAKVSPRRSKPRCPGVNGLRALPKSCMTGSPTGPRLAGSAAQPAVATDGLPAAEGGVRLFLLCEGRKPAAIAPSAPHSLVLGMAVLAVRLLQAGGGILLFVGLASRLIALPLAFDMMVAYLTADREALGSIFSDPGKFYNADPFTFLLASLIILAFGPGWFSLDNIIKWYRSKRTPPAAANPQ